MSDGNDWVDLHDEARPPAGAWLYVVTGLAIAFAVACLALMPGCGPIGEADRASPSADFDVNDGVTVDPASVGLESTSHAITGADFGQSGYNTNYQCRQGSCVCDNTTHTGRDCTILRLSGKCLGTLFCTDGGLGREICICDVEPPSNPCGPDGCGGGPIASIDPLPNGYIQNGIALFFRVAGSNSSCVVPAANQTMPLSSYPGTNASTLQSLNDTFSGRYCVAQEYLTSQGLADGIYQTPSTQLYKKYGHRGCRLSSADWATIPHPPVTQIAQGQAVMFDGGPCRPMELFAN